MGAYVTAPARALTSRGSSQVPARIKRNGTEKDNDEFMDLLVEPLRDAGLIVEAFYSLPSNSRDKKPHSIFLVVSAR